MRARRRRPAPEALPGIHQDTDHEEGDRGPEARPRRAFGAGTAWAEAYLLRSGWRGASGRFRAGPAPIPAPAALTPAPQAGRSPRASSASSGGRPTGGMGAPSSTPAPRSRRPTTRTARGSPGSRRSAPPGGLRGQVAVVARCLGREKGSPVFCQSTRVCAGRRGRARVVGRPAAAAAGREDQQERRERGLVRCHALSPRSIPSTSTPAACSTPAAKRP